MHDALNKVLSALPDDTKVFVRDLSERRLSLLMRFQPGHEYTKSNCKFLNKVLQTEAVKKLTSFAENNKETQGQFTMGDEKVRGYHHWNKADIN